METTTVGRLRVQARWEDLLTSLPEHAEGPEGLGKIWEHEDAPRNPGHDPVVKQGWRLQILHGVKLHVPVNAEIIEVAAEASATGETYTLIRVDRTAIHLHGKVGVQKNDEGGRFAVGNAHICARVFWPKGADERNSGVVAWRNYLLYVDIFPSATGKLKHELEIYPEGTSRTPVIMLGSEEELEGDEPQMVVAWATRSANWRTANGRQPSTGSDQLFVIKAKC